MSTLGNSPQGLSEWPGTWQPNYGMQGMPMMGGGGTGMMLQMVLQGFAQNMMGSAGMMPMGLSQQNMYDRFQSQYFTAQHNQLIQNMAQRDRPAAMQLWRGVANAAGQPWGDEQFRAANSLVSAQLMASPALVEMAPQFLDAMMGERGSAAVMAHYMFRGGRNRIDPVTGQWGLQAEGAEDLTTRVFDRLYSNRGARDAYGLSAGETGQLFWALQREGRLPGGDPLESLEAADPGFMRGAMRDVDLQGSVRGLRTGDRSLLMDQPQVQERLRSFDAKRVSNTLREWAGSIHAMREIFGDAGMPNAPMPMLIGALEQLTAGGMTQFGPGRAQNMVRNTANLANLSGVGLQGAMVMQQAAMPMVQQLGLDPIFANMATQRTMAFTAGYQAEGMGAMTGWGTMNLGQLQQAEQRLQLGAAASQSANQMGALLRAQRMGMITPGSGAENYLNAMQLGSTSYVDASGNVRSMDLSSNQYANLMQTGTGGRLTSGEALMMLGQTSANQEMLARNPAAIGVTRRLQRGDMARELGIVMGSPIANALAGRMGDDISQGDAAVLGRVLGTAGQAAFFGATQEVAGDATKLQAAMGGRMRTELETLAQGDGPQATAAQRILAQAGDDPSFLGSMAGVAFGEADQWLRQTGRGTMRGQYALMSDQVMQQAARATAKTQLDTQLQNAMAPLGGRNMVRRAAEAVMQAKPGDPNALWKIAGKILGGENKAEMEAIMRPKLVEMQKLGDQYRRLGERIQMETDPEERQRLWTEAEKISGTIEEKMTEVNKQFKDAGFDINTIMDQGQLAYFQKQSAQIDELVGGTGDLSKAALSVDAFSMERANTRDVLAQYFSDTRTAEKLGGRGLEQIGTIRDMMQAEDVLARRRGVSVQQLGEMRDPEFLAMRAKRQEAVNWIAARVGKDAVGPPMTEDELEAFRMRYGDEATSYLESGKEAFSGMLQAFGGGMGYEDFAGSKQFQNIMADIRGGGARGRSLEAAMRQYTGLAENWDTMTAAQRKEAQKKYGRLFGKMGIGGGLAPSKEAILEELEEIRQSTAEPLHEGDAEAMQVKTIRIGKLVLEADGSATITSQDDEGKND